MNEYLNVFTHCQYLNAFVNNLDRFKMQSLLVLRKYFLSFNPRGVVLKFGMNNLLAYLGSCSQSYVLSRYSL